MKLSRDKLEELLVGCVLDARKENLIAKCPKCGHQEFGISLSDGHRFGCYRKKKCGFTGNIFTLLHYLGKYEEYVVRGEVYSVDSSPTVQKRIVSKKEAAPAYEEAPEISLPIGWKKVERHSYLDERGFTEEDYKKYSPGITKLASKFHNYIIFPIIEKSIVRGYVARHIWSKKELDNWNKGKDRSQQIQRYRNSNEADFSKLVLGIDELSEKTTHLIIVEGLFDKKNIDQLLDLNSQDEFKCIGTFKCHISPTQLHKILVKAPFLQSAILLYDNDVLKEIIETGFLLSKFIPTKIGYDDSIEEDAGDMSEKQLDNIFANFLYTPEELSVKKIRKRKLD